MNKRLASTASIGVFLALAFPAASLGASVEIKNSPVQFTKDVQSLTATFYLDNPEKVGQGTAEALFIGVSIVPGKDATHYAVKSECSGVKPPPFVLMKAPEGSSATCRFETSDNCPGMIKSEAEVKYELPPLSGEKKLNVVLEKP